MGSFHDCTQICMHCSAEELQRQDDVNICYNYTGSSTNLTVVSPGYPHYYPQQTECRCMVTAQRHSEVVAWTVHAFSNNGYCYL